MSRGKLKMPVIMFLMLILRCACAEDIYVYPTILQERSTADNLVLRLHRNFTLNLGRSSVLADKLLLVTSSHQGDQLETVDTLALQEVLYQDTHHQSSVILRQNQGVVQVEGIINHELRIKPLPQHERSLQGEVLHKIYKVKELHGPDMSMAYHSKQRRTRPRPTNTQKFTAEVHVISDSVHQKSFKENEELIAYLAIMTNAVNLRYLDMRDPELSLLLVGITRSKDDPFAHHKDGYLLAEETLEGLRQYNRQGRVPGKPDMVFLITGQDLAGERDGKLRSSPTGLAMIGTVCKYTYSYVGEGEDTATGYTGTGTMAHELAHILGAEHDGSRNKDPECAWEKGYLMSYVDGGTKKFRLSKCAEQEIRETFRELKPDCIAVMGSKNYLDSYRKFPGQTIRQKKYCRLFLGRGKTGIHVEKDQAFNEKCKMKCCYDHNSKVWCNIATIPTGMTCGEGKTCKRGVCGVHTW